jgi:predicted RNA-binding protein associated with RNAse of E/G family
LVLKKGDRFLEYYFDDRWFNIFQIHDRISGRIKGWYCNIGYPAEFQPDSISYRDLALDLLVYPDGRQTVLDQDEFAELPLRADVVTHAIVGLEELQILFRKMENHNIKPADMELKPFLELNTR